MVSSIFVGNLHGGIDPSSIRNYFIRAGNVQDIYIPTNQKSLQRVYGFVRFNTQEEARKVIRRCDGDFVWGRELIVRQAHRERREALDFNSTAKSQGPGSKFQPQLRNQSAGVDKMNGANSCPWGERPFSEVLKGKPTKQSIKDPPIALEEMGNLDYKSKEMDINWLKGCAVAYLSKHVDIKCLENHLRVKGIHCKLIYMGGNMNLLAFLSEGLMKAAISENYDWFAAHFDYIKPWEHQDMPKSRYVWLKCMNTPLHAWNLEFFRLIGNQYGTFKLVDHQTEFKKRLDYGRMLVFTNILQPIARKHRVTIDGRLYEIEVEEDQNKTFNPEEDLQLLEQSSFSRLFWEGENHGAGQAPLERGEEEGEIQSEFQNSNLNLKAKLGAANANDQEGANIRESPQPSIGPQPFRLQTQSTHPNLNPPTSAPVPVVSPTLHPSYASNLAEPPKSTESIPVVLDSPAEYGSLNVSASHNPPIDVIEYEDISLEEEYNQPLCNLKRSTKKGKRVEKRKSINSLVSCSGGSNILRSEMAKQTKLSKAKSNRKRGGRGKKRGITHEVIQDITSEGHELDIIPEVTPKVTSVGSLPDAHIRNRNEEIRRAAEATWNLALAVGMTAGGPKDAVLGLLEEDEERDWDAYEQMQNE